MSLPLQISNCLINSFSLPMNCWSIGTTSQTAAFKIIFTFCFVTSKIKAHTPIFKCCLCIPNKMCSLYIFFQDHFLEGLLSSVSPCVTITRLLQFSEEGRARRSCQKLNILWDSASHWKLHSLLEVCKRYIQPFCTNRFFSFSMKSYSILVS